MKKRVIAVLMSLALIVPAAACGAQSSPAQAPAAEEEEAAEAVEEAAPEEAPAEEAPAEEAAAEETAAAELTEADLTAKFSEAGTIPEVSSFKELDSLEGIVSQAKEAGDGEQAVFKVDEPAEEVVASLSSGMQALSYGGVILQVPSNWLAEATDDGKLITYPPDGHCIIVVEGMSIRGYDPASIMPALREGARKDGRRVSDFSAGGKNGLKMEYPGDLDGIPVNIQDYFFLPSDSWLISFTCVTTRIENFDSTIQTVDFSYAIQ